MDMYEIDFNFKIRPFYEEANFTDAKMLMSTLLASAKIITENEADLAAFYGAAKTIKDKGKLSINQKDLEGLHKIVRSFNISLHEKMSLLEILNKARKLTEDEIKNG